MPKSSSLDDKLLLKIANKLHKQETISVRKSVSAKASKLHISPQAALVIMAHELGIKSAVYERSLSGDIQEQIRSFSGLKAGVSQSSSIRSTRRIGSGTAKISHKRPWWENPWLLAVGSVVIGGLILAYLFGVGR